MTTALNRLEEQARTLPSEDRARFVEILLESLREPPVTEIESLWDREIELRLEAFDRGETQASAAEEVFAEARRILR